MGQHRDKSPLLNRRKFLQIIAIAGAAGAGWQMGISPDNLEYRVVRRSRPMMGTVLNFIAYGPDQDAMETALSGTIEWMLELEKHLSRYRPDSEVSRLNRTGRLDLPGPDLVKVLELAQVISQRSAGAFDVTVLPLVAIQQKFKGLEKPAQSHLDHALQLVGYQNLRITDQKIILSKPGMGITLDGIAKGYIVDQGVAALKAYGFDNIYVEAGGDLMVQGHKPRNKAWRIGIENPRPAIPHKLVVLAASNRAIATSGDYMQAYSPDFSRHHIVNPATGFSPPELASSTVTAPRVALADALATASMVLGARKSIELLESMPACQGYFIAKDLKHWQTSKFFG